MHLGIIRCPALAVAPRVQAMVDAQPWIQPRGSGACGAEGLGPWAVGHRDDSFLQRGRASRTGNQGGSFLYSPYRSATLPSIAADMLSARPQPEQHPSSPDIIAKRREGE